MLKLESEALQQGVKKLLKETAQELKQKEDLTKNDKQKLVEGMRKAATKTRNKIKEAKKVYMSKTVAAP